MANGLTKTLGNLSDDIGYKAGRTGVMAVGKSTAPVLGQLIDASVAPLAKDALFFVQGATLGIIGGKAVIATGATIALLSGLSAVLAQVDHQHRRSLIQQEFQEEIAAAHSISPAKITPAHMDQLAETNPTLKDALKRSASERNLSVVISSIASVGAFFAVQAIFGESNAVKELFEHGEVGKFILHVAAGLAAYIGIHTPLHAAGSRIMELDQETVQERIRRIHRERACGEMISQEVVLGVLLAAQPDLARQIEDSYGKPFEALNNTYKREIIASLNNELMLEKITGQINLGQMKPEELAFLAYGQKSGVSPRQAAQRASESGKTKSRFSTENIVNEASERVDLSAIGLPGQTELNIAVKDAGNADVHLQNQYEAPGIKRLFTASIGRSTHQRTFVERINSSSIEVRERS